MQQKIVITGGPGTGKSTVIEELERRGFVCVHEISRQIILNAQQNGIDQLFLTDPLLFSKLLLEGRTQQYIDANKLTSEILFFDRGLPDIHSYMNYTNTSYPNVYIDSCKKYKYSKVFLMPPWKDIYTTDNERYESFDESLKIYKSIKKGYSQLGYDFIEVPFGSVKFRTDFILDITHIK